MTETVEEHHQGIDVSPAPACSLHFKVYRKTINLV